MPKTVLAALAAVTILSGAMLVGPAAAMPSAAVSSAPARTALVHEATMVCGGGGCVPVQTKQVQRKKFHPLGYTKPI
jgi:hypothetical protein